jgi:hypothetical protein
MINFKQIQELTAGCKPRAILARIQDVESEIHTRAQLGYDSFSTENVRFAAEIIEHLTKAGFKVWHDKGHNYQRETIQVSWKA